MKIIRVIPDIIEFAAERQPEKKALLHNDDSRLYMDIYAQSFQLAGFLNNTGVKKGARICIFFEKRMEKVIGIFGISISGCILVPIRRLSTTYQAVHIISDCEAEVLITTPSRARQLSDQIHRMPSLKTIILLDKTDTIIPIENIPIFNWNDIMAQPPASARRIQINEQDLAAILYTSGSTGKPKGVILNHLNIVQGAKKVTEYLRIREEEKILGILSFGFDYGLNQLTTAFLNCAQLILLDYLFPKDILNTVGKYSITGLAAVATTWIRLLQIPWHSFQLDTLRYITNSGGAIPKNYVAELRKRLPKTDIFLMYGLTEAFRSTYLDPSLIDKHPTSIGKAIPGEEIIIIDKDNRPVKPGQIGELVHRGLLVSKGYWGDPELTAIRFRPSPFQNNKEPLPETVVYSGDQVKVDEEGFLFFIGRKDEMIKVAGNRISPNEIEDAMYRIAGIAKVVAFGIPDELYGQTVFAVISLLPGHRLDIHQIKKQCAVEMPAYMIPKDIEVWQEIPLNDNGKIDRAAVKTNVLKKVSGSS